MRYLLLEKYKGYSIINDDAGFVIGYVSSANGREGPFSVFACITPAHWGSIEIATVNSLYECVAALADYYDKNPSRWERRSAELYEKRTIFSVLCVEHSQEGHWHAYRDSYPMMRDCKPASFSTCAEAQRAADVHQLDYYPDAKTIDDDLSWVLDPEIDWRSLPEVVEARARWEVLASLSLP